MADGTDTGATTTTTTTTDTGDGSGSNGNGAATATAATSKSFTQDQVNDLLAREKGNLQRKYADYDDLKAAAARLQEIEDSNKTELQKATGERDTFKTRAESAESKLARYEAAAKAGLPLEHAHRLAGSSPKELEEDAKKLAEFLGGNASEKTTSFDGGARTAAPTTDMNAFIRQGANRNRV